MENDTEHFERCARAYCALIETVSSSQLDLLRRIREVLLPLYSAALTLPQIGEPRYYDVPEDEERIRVNAMQLYQRLPELGFHNAFWVMFSPLNLDNPDPVQSSLSDCLTDIWRDLKPGLEALDKYGDKYRVDVIWQWRFSFQTHWGRHAIDALRAIHFHLQDTV